MIEKKNLSAKELLDIARSCFAKVNLSSKDGRGRKPKIGLLDCLMSSLAMFGLKFPSLLQFDKNKEEEIIKHNLHTLYGVKNASSDSYMRDLLDNVDPQNLRESFTATFAPLQRGKILEPYKYIDNHYLLLPDGTGTYSSKCVGCENCCEKHHKDGTVTYYHQMLAGVIALPDRKEVFPVCPEPISKKDGIMKNDCERNAAFRLLDDFRREHPHLKTIIISDALSSNGPYIKKLQKLGLRYIITVKTKGNKTLFEYIEGIKLESHKIEKDGSTYEMQWINNLPLNDTYPDVRVNFFKCTVTEKNGIKKNFSWVTDIKITKQHIFLLVRAGRTRWKIENETFNTLKNQDYQYERNYGHGKKHLCHVFGVFD